MISAARLRTGSHLLWTLVLVLVAGLLPAVASAAEPSAAGPSKATPSATRLTGFSTARAGVRVGGARWDAVTVWPKSARTVTVQYRPAGARRFTSEYVGKASPQGRFVASEKPIAAGVWEFRLFVAASSRAKALLSPVRIVRASGRATTTKVSGFPSTWATVTLGGAVTDNVTVLPHAARTVQVQSRLVGAKAFVTVARGSSSKAGAFRAVYRPTQAGMWEYRLVVRASAVARQAASLIRPVRVTPRAVPTSTPTSTPTPTQVPTDTAPGPVRGVTAVSTTSTSISLSWTNPTDADFAGVIIRRAPGVTPPASATAGTSVAKTSAASRSFNDTGLVASTTYSYALFAFDTGLNLASGVTASTKTGAPTAAILSINGSTGATAKETRKEAPFIDLSESHAALGRDLTGGLLSYGDGTTQAFTSADPQPWTPDGYAYATLDPFTVTWSVTDSAGTTATTHIDVQVFAPSSVRIAAQKGGGGNPKAPTAVSFDVTAGGITDGTHATSYDFFATNADGAIVTGSAFAVAGAPRVVTLFFATPGDYTVELDVDTDAGAFAATDTTTVRVR